MDLTTLRTSQRSCQPPFRSRLPASPRKAIAQSCHVAGICSGGGGIEYSKGSAVAPKCADRDYTPMNRLPPAPPPPNPHHLRPPPLSRTHVQMRFLPLHVVELLLTFHRCAATGPVKASAKPLGPVIRRQRAAAAHHPGSRGRATHCTATLLERKHTRGGWKTSLMTHRGYVCSSFLLVLKDFMGLSWVHQLHEGSQQPPPSPPTYTHARTRTHAWADTNFSPLWLTDVSHALGQDFMCSAAANCDSNGSLRRARTRLFVREAKFKYIF